MMKRYIFAFAAVLLAAGPGLSDSFTEIQTRRPELFDAKTGYRIARQRAPTPDDIPLSAQHVSPKDAQQLIASGAVALDVFGASQSRYDELDGTWLVSTTRMSLPGAVWLPEVGRGTLTPQMQSYLAKNLARLTDDQLDQPIVVYCIADCWMSWNAAQRIASLGYSHVYWFRLGTDGWLDIGGELHPVDPVPVNVD